MPFILNHFFAYIDPGSGSLILQAAIGFLLAIGVFFRSSIRRFFDSIKRVFGDKKTKTDD